MSFENLHEWNDHLEFFSRPQVIENLRQHLRLRTDILQKTGHGQGRAWGGNLTFSKICNQIPCPRADHSNQMQPNFPTPGCTLLSIPRKNPRKTE